MIAIIGNFANGQQTCNGQTVKTRILTDFLTEAYGKDNIVAFDTAGGVRTIFRVLFIVIRALASSADIVILPAHNAIRIFVPVLAFLQNFFAGRRIHYVVIGGWLPDFIKGKRLLRHSLHKLFMIYAETHKMKKDLIDMGYHNVTYMPNFKPLQIVSDIQDEKSEPYPLCTFSRVASIKGISDAVDAVAFVNSEFGRAVFTLDIYGKVEDGENNWFDTLIKSAPKEVKYKGCVPFDRSVQVLESYAFLLFPTRYFGEGIPGTIIDAYAAGLPVVSSRYPNFSEIIDDGVTGLGYEFNNADGLKYLLMKIAENPEMVLSLKRNCIKKAELFQPQNVIRILTDNFLLSES